MIEPDTRPRPVSKEPPTQVSGEVPSRARHARETLARLGAVNGGVSRESARQWKAISQVAQQTEVPDVAELASTLLGEVMAGTRSLNSAYRHLNADGQRRLLLTLPDWLDDQLREAASES